MSQLVMPEVYWIGYTGINNKELTDYLEDSGNLPFLDYLRAAREGGLSDAEILCSIFAKLCYKSLSVGHNNNISKVRDIESNIINCFDVGHGSVFEHVNFSFIIANCSRVFSHELVRHRVGTAFSQNSGRYIRIDSLDFVADPILGDYNDLTLECLDKIEKAIYELECKVGLRAMNFDDPEAKWEPNDDLNFTIKKKLTSAIRRLAPNGQANEIGFTVNLRALRHTIMVRTARHSEWEIRYIFAQIYNILKARFKTIFHGAKEEIVDGIVEVTGLRMQPYESA